mgnify:FL=1
MTFAGNITLASNSTAQGQENASTLCFVNDPNAVKLRRVIAYSTLILISLIGNVLTVTAILQYHGKTRKTITYSVVNMTVANLVITVSYMPRLIPMFLIGVEWLIVGPLGYALCKIVPFLHGVAIVASILNLLFTSLDMFLVVVFPMKRFSSTKAARLGVLLTWTLAIIARLPYLIALRTKVSKGINICSSSLSNAFGNGNKAREIYYTILLITFYAIPWVAIFCFYLAIVLILGKGQTPGQRNATAICVREARVKAVRSIMKMMAAITFMFLTCWITYFSATLAFKRIPCSFRFWRMFLAHSNCAISPILVASFNKNIRKGIKAILYKSKLFCYCIRSSSRVARFSLRGPTSFSVNEYMDVADFGRINRRRVIRWKRGSEDLANVNHEGICTSSVRLTPILTFKTLQKDRVNEPNDDRNGKNANHAEVNPAFRNP